MLHMTRQCVCLLFVVATALLSPSALAYIGPGAGAGFVGSLLTTLSVIVVSLVAILVWPVRLLIRRLRRRKTPDVLPGDKSDSE